MKLISSIVLFILFFSSQKLIAQNITYAPIEKGNARNTLFEIIGKVSGNFLVYKSLFNTHKISVFNNDLSKVEDVKLDYVSDKTTTIDFIPFTDKALMIWQFQKRNVLYSMAATIGADGKLVGNVVTLDTTKITTFSNNTYQNIRWSEDKKKILFYKHTTKGDDYHLVTKIYDNNFTKLDSSRSILDFQKNKESFSDLQIDNNGNIVFLKTHERNSEDYLSQININYKKILNDTIFTLSMPLDDQIIKDPMIKIDNFNNKIILNAFSYRKYSGVVIGLYAAILNTAPLEINKKAVNIFSDTLLNMLSGKPDWKSAYENFFFKNIISKKDGGYVIISEEFYKERRATSAFNDRSLNSIYNNNNFGYSSDYYSYNRGNYGYYRPFNDNNNRDVVYHYDDVIIFSFSKDLQLQWNSVINKSSSDVDTDNSLSFVNMNTGGEIHFFFFQKENRQILSNHSLQPNGNIIRNPTLKSRENGFEFMPKLGRQTGAKQLMIPCIARGGISFAKIEF